MSQNQLPPIQSPPAFAPPPTLPSALDSLESSSEDVKYQQKFTSTKKEVDKLEETNAKLLLRISRAKKVLERLKFERKLLFEKLESLDTSEIALNASASSNININSHSQHHHSINQTFNSNIENNLNLLQQHHNNNSLHDNMQASSVSKSAGAVGETEDDESGDETDVLSVAVEEVVTAAVASKKKKRKKDPNAPKKPANAFLMYCQLVREQVREENPEITRAELTKALGTKWKSMPEDEKKKYYDLYEKDKERYATEMKDYEAAGGPPGGEKKDDELNADMEKTDAMDEE